MSKCRFESLLSSLKDIFILKCLLFTLYNILNWIQNIIKNHSLLQKVNQLQYLEDHIISLYNYIIIGQSIVVEIWSKNNL
jgi:hypothetical protein